MTLTQLFTKT